MTDRGGPTFEASADYVDAVMIATERHFEEIKKLAESGDKGARAKLLGVASRAANVIEILVGKTDAEVPDRQNKIDRMKVVTDYWEDWRNQNPVRK